MLGSFFIANRQEMENGMERVVYWIKKTLNWKWRYCSKFCVTCKYFETCKNDDVLS